MSKSSEFLMNEIDICNDCDGCGCPKCLGYGFTINKLVAQYNYNFKLTNNYVVIIDEFYSLPVACQYALRSYIKAFIKLNKNRFKSLFKEENE